MENIIKISIALTIVGIIGLYIFTSTSQTYVEIYDLKDFIGQRVTVKGTVGGYYTSKDGHVFFDLQDQSGACKAVVFRSSNIEAAYNLKDGEKIIITGKVQEYKDSLEIIASKIDF